MTDKKVRAGRAVAATIMAAGALMVMLAAACGDGGAEPAPTINQEEQALLEQMVLQLGDLPQGLQRVTASFSTNTDVAEAQLNPEEQLEKLQRWGRRLGYDVSFEPTVEAPPDLPVRGLQNTVSLYAAAQGAGDSFAAGIESARNTDWPALYPGLAELEVNELQEQRPDLADEALWVRISGFQERDGEQQALVIDDQVALRVGQVRTFLRVVTLFESGASRDAYTDQVESWAALVRDRIRAALQEGETAMSPGP
jgi:hypothetical protein